MLCRSRPGSSNHAEDGRAAQSDYCHRIEIIAGMKHTIIALLAIVTTLTFAAAPPYQRMDFGPALFWTYQVAPGNIAQKGIIIRDMNAYGLPEWIRVSIGTMEQNRRFLNELKKLELARTVAA